MKKVIASLLLGAALLSVAPLSAAAETAPTILLDGIPLGFPVPPTIVQDRTMVPFRAIAEALGVSVTWVAEQRAIDARYMDREVRLTIDNDVAWISGFPVKLDVAPMIVNDRTLVPLRFFSEAFGANVGWEGTTRTVTITSPARPMRTMAFYAISSFDERSLVSRFSDVAFGWSALKADGTLDLTDDPLYRWPQPAGDVSGESLLADAQRQGVGRHLMISALDDKSQFTALILDETLRQKAAAEIAAVVRGKGFDGVVLDMEYLGQTETGAELEKVRQAFTAFVQAISKELRASGKETIVAVHPLNGAFHGYDYKALAAAADMVVVMAHDYHDHQVDKRPDSADKVMEAIELSLRDVPRERLMLAIVAPYETPETLLQKVGLAKRYGLEGITVWRLGTVGTQRMKALEGTVSPEK